MPTSVTAPVRRPATARQEVGVSGHLGIELGSTRIKAVLVDDAGTVLGAGAHAWQNELVDGSWTYPLDAVWQGVRACCAELSADLRTRHGAPLAEIGSLGISAMMHGYLAFDADDRLLTPFRTWRNTFTEDASTLLSTRFGRNVPQRWSVAHLLHAVLAGEEHVGRIRHLTTLAGYVHWRLSGRRVLGVGDASGMFPIDAATRDYDRSMIDSFERLDAVRGVGWSLTDLLPEVLVAGSDAGRLTPHGAALLDPSRALVPGAPMAPPEGDAGTGMVATNTLRPATGHVSAGTSAFAMVVLDRELGRAREEIDPVTTPVGDPVAMVHTNNCTGDLDAWLRLLGQFAAVAGAELEAERLYRVLFDQARDGAPDCGGVLSYNCLSGEHQTRVRTGRPLLVRAQEADFTLANFARAQLYGAFGALACGMEVLLVEERIRLRELFAHGGIFRTRGVAQQVLADALDTRVVVGESAGEGGAWGMALLAAYRAGVARVEARGEEPVPLVEHLDQQVFGDRDETVVEPDPAGVAGYRRWLREYRAGLPVERLAGEVLG